MADTPAPDYGAMAEKYADAAEWVKCPLPSREDAAPIIAALRIARVVTAPTDEEAEKVGLASEMAHDVSEPYLAMLAGKARAGFAAIAKITQGAGSE